MNGRTNEPKSSAGKEATGKKRSSLAPISVPKGGGAILGIGEKFPADPVTGTGSTPVPIYTSPGHSGFGLQFFLSAYAVAVLAVGGAVVATLELGSAVKHTPTLFFCSVFFSSWIGGAVPGIFACLLSAIALDYYFIPPLYALGIGLEEAPDMIAFVVSGLVISWLSGERKRANDSLRKARDELHARVCEGTYELRQTDDQLQAGIARRSAAEEDPVKADAQEARAGCTRMIGELAAPIASESTRKPLPHPPTICPPEESVFSRQGDYWTIQYQGQIARLKTTRGLHCLATLLGQPEREFHVNELIAAVGNEQFAAVEPLASSTSKEDGSQMRTTCFPDAGPILDARAKVEYARRVADLRGELEDANRLNDPERAARARQEMEDIADQLAVAAGLGGRDRRAGSQTERARSTVTKRIKSSVNKIAETMPALGLHLADRIKTGYFCSYNPHPDRPVKWKLEF